jgi:predicted MPP superfamily phosphohydrolase
MSMPFAKRSAKFAICFDLAIAILIVGSVISVMTAMTILESGLTLSAPYRAFLALTIVVMGVGGCLTFWGSVIEPNLLVIRRRRFSLGLKQSLKIAIASDMHIGIYRKKSFTRKIVRKLNALKADIILLPGDFMDDEMVPLLDLSPLKDLRAKYGVFAVNGNHDAGAYMRHWTHELYFEKDRTAELSKLLRSYGIHFLRNEHKVLSIGTEKLVIAGTDDAFLREYDVKKTLKNAPKNIPIIMMTHTPDVILNKDSHQANLIVSGHTHGGQIRLPFIGPLFAIPDLLGKTFDRGFFKLTKTCTLLITEGIGVTGVRARLFCPPEIVLLKT